MGEPGTHARRVVGIDRTDPLRGRPSALRSHAPASPYALGAWAVPPAPPALRANDAGSTTDPRS
ncbi:hypothetical protein CXR04_33815 [Streptomyces sp. CMB-StM0423]|nr:hypothetical protein CXR04_33815 [Streptomyces sp. CMB-StM0423]